MRTNQHLWFTADHHFGHANIMRYCHRPFASADEMDATLIRLWNETVGSDDVVYHLGDFTLQGMSKFKAIVGQLRGHLRILPGSHDRRWLDQFQADDPELHTADGHAIALLPPLVSLEVPDLRKDRYPQVVVLCHYALRVWDRSHYGSWHLYGHSHGHLPGLGSSLDVGVDCHGYRPLSLAEVAEKLQSLPPSVADPGSEQERDAPQ
jgi:calcineurin-like phosphoesterase family protein